MTDTDESDTGDDTEDENEGNFVSGSTTHRFHQGTADDGARCGQVLNKGRWTDLGASNPLQVVVKYGVEPCLKCFDRYRSQLHTLVLIDHSAYRVRDDREDVIDRLPWELDGDPENEREAADAEVGQA